MADYKLEFSRVVNGQKELIVEEHLHVANPSNAEGEQNLGWELMAEFHKGIRFGNFLPNVPNAKSDLAKASGRTIEPHQYLDVANTDNLWMEIFNTLADVRFLMAQSVAYKELEPPIEQDDRKSIQTRYYSHFAKMYAFNLAIYGTVKIQDLVVRMLFENFGATLIKVDPTKPDWERDLTLGKALGGLETRLHSGELSKPEYSQIVKALNIPYKSKSQEMLIAYRNRLVHRIRPSVDYPELFTALQDRIGTEIRDHTGKVIGRRIAVLSTPTKPDYYFRDLYEAALNYLEHVVQMLDELKKVQRFS